MLTRQIEDSDGDLERRGLKAIARRVSTLAQVYDHLLGTEMSRTTDFGSYIKGLCASLSEIQDSTGDIKLTCESDVVYLNLDVVTALGILVAEVVANSYEHAFPDGKGTIDVTAHLSSERPGMMTLIIRDDGSGFEVMPGSKRHGVGLVRRLAEQANGHAAVDGTHGTVWTVELPVM
jgi:two-component sensor histidine kinase